MHRRPCVLVLTVSLAIGSTLTGCQKDSAGESQPGSSHVAATDSVQVQPLDAADRGTESGAPASSAELPDLSYDELVAHAAAQPSAPGVVKFTAESISGAGELAVLGTTTGISSTIVLTQWFDASGHVRTESDITTSGTGVLKDLAGAMPGSSGKTVVVRDASTVYQYLADGNTWSKTALDAFSWLPLSNERPPMTVAEVDGELGKRFDFQVTSTESVAGRPAYRIEATPKSEGAGGHPMFEMVSGMTLWVDGNTWRVLQMAMELDPMRKAAGSNTSGAPHMTIAMNTSITDWQEDVSVPDDFFTFTPPAGAKESVSMQAVSQALGSGGPIPDVSSFAEARAALDYPVLEVSALPAGCSESKVELHSLLSGKHSPDAMLRQDFDCPGGGEITIQQGPAGENLLDAGEMMAKAMKLTAKPVTIGSATGTMWLSGDEPLAMRWDTPTTRVNITATFVDNLGEADLLALANAMH